jgi:hypothetical protein
MKMLYPRKIDEVLWHSATRFFSKIDLGVDAEAANDAGDGVPIHLDQAVGRFRRHVSKPPW